jgi:hypothetical protein
MTLNRDSFRRGAIAAAALAGASLLAAFSVAAQDVKGSPECAGIKDGIQAIQCEVKGLDKRTDAANKRATASDNELACLDLIMKDLKSNGAKTASLTAVPPKGQACKTARDLKLISG